jgi:O-antigen/teichoic acid export membrane protein
MNSTTTSQAETLPRTKHSATNRQIRGSSLLLAGRLFSKFVNLIIQVLTVRVLSEADYGAFAYALSLVALGETIATIGLDRAITRFVPIYHEKRDYDKLFGTMIMVVGTVLAIGAAMILLVFGFQGLIGQSLIKDQQAVALLLILIALSPVQALDGLMVGLFAVFASPRAIFFRKHVVAPGLKLVAVVLLIMSGSNVFVLAGGYLAAGALGVAIYTGILLRLMRDQGWFQHFNLRSISMPWKEVFAFTIPLLSSDLVYVLMNSSDVILLERFHNTSEVAALKAVHPAAMMNQLVMTSFALLFTPMAARLFARDDREGINNLYWQTAIWIAVFSFPIFALSFSLAEPLTVLLFGARYEQSAIILALLSLGYYFNAALGFNGLTLKVFGKLRYIVTVNIAAALVNVGVNLLLIPRYGALGAAIGTCGTLVAHNLFKQAGLALGTGISLFEWRHLKIYMVIALGALGLLLIQITLSPPPLVSLVLAGLASGLVILINRSSLAVGQTFPELLRFPFMRRLFGE